MTPDGVRELERHGIKVFVEAGAGEGASIADADYVAAGADIVPTAEDAWSQEMVVKVKEPMDEEFGFLRQDLTLFTYLHLAAYPDVAKALIAAGTTALAYETVQLDDGSLPLLAPMSEVAGRLAPQQGAHFLERHKGGRGVLMGGAPGVRPAKVVVLGAGNVGWNAAWIAAGMEAEVVLIDKNLDRLRWVDQIHKGRIMTLASNRGRHRAQRRRRRPGDRRRARGRRAGAGDRQRGHGAGDEAPLGDRRRRRRPGWLHRDDPRDDPRRSGVRAARRHPLRRRQHAGRGAEHEHVRPHQRHAAVHPGGRRARRRPAPPSGTRRSPSASTPSAGHVTNEPVAEFLGVEFVEPLVAFWLDATAVRTPTLGSRRYRRCMSTAGSSTPISAFDLDLPILEQLRRRAPVDLQDERRGRGRAELDRPQRLRLHRPPLRRRGGGAARQALAQRDVTDHGDAGHHRSEVPRPPAHIDPVGRGRRAHPAAASRRPGVLAPGRRPPASVHARGDGRRSSMRWRRAAGPTSPPTSASRTRSRSSASCSARRRRTGSCSAAGPPTCCASSTAT